MKITFDLGKRIIAFLKEILSPQPTTLKHGNIMFIVAATNPDIRYKILPPDEVRDEEGEVITPMPKLAYAISSDNPDAVSVIPDDPANPIEGTVHFGSTNLTGDAIASVNATAMTADGSKLLVSYGEMFTVTFGSPDSVVGGGLEFAGLTPAEPV